MRRRRSLEKEECFMVVNEKAPRTSGCLGRKMKNEVIGNRTAKGAVSRCGADSE